MKVRGARVIISLVVLMAGSGSQALAAGPVPQSEGVSGKPGSVIAWGDNEFGQVDVPAQAQSGVTAIAAGSHHAIAIRKGRVIAWGDNQFGQVDVPAQAQAGVTAIAAGGTHSLALKGGRVIAWGSNRMGESSIPSDALEGVEAIAAGSTFSMALKGGRVIVWGSPTGVEGVPLPIDPPTETQSGVSAIAAGGVFAMAVKDGRVIAWGDNTHGETSVPVDAQSGVSQIAAGGDAAMAVKDGRVIAWGGFPGSGITAVPADAQSGVSQVSASAALMLALRGGRVIAWGSDSETYGARNVPDWAQRGMTAVSAGGYFGVAISGAIPPGPPRDLRIVGQAPGVLRVTWKAPKPNGSAKVTGYLVSYQGFGAGQAWTSLPAAKPTISIPGLQPGSVYRIRVSARTAQATSLAFATDLGVA